MSLEPPTVTLTAKQQFFAGGHLGGLEAIKNNTDCRIELRWKGGMLSPVYHRLV